MARTRGGASTPAVALLLADGARFTERPYDHDPRAESFGREAAEALGVAPERVFKTLLASVGTDGDLAVAVVPVDGQLDLKALAAELGVKKASMADPAVAERATGYVVGGISPLGQRTSLPTVLDLSAAEHDTILVSGGRRGLDLELSPDDLARLTGARLASISAPGRPARRR